MSTVIKRPGWDTVIAVASGPSLTDEQRAIATAVQRAGLCRIAVVNNNWREFPHADLLYATDGPWWERYGDEVRSGFTGECWTRAPRLDPKCINRVEREHAETVAARPWLNCVPVSTGEGLASDGTVNMGGNSGYALIGLLIEEFGTRRMPLIGYDMQRGPNGERHHHPDHPKPLTNGVPTAWIRRFDTLAKDAKARGVEIVNCSITTALTQFPRADLRTALA